MTRTTPSPSRPFPEEHPCASASSPAAATVPV
jgi:hypothetical protein